MKKFERLNNAKAMHNGSGYGPVFGNAWDIYLNSTMTSGREQYNYASVFFSWLFMCVHKCFYFNSLKISGSFSYKNTCK